MTRHPAAHINAIAEAGTKADAIEWLQKHWDENCELYAEIERLRAENKELLTALRDLFYYSDDFRANVRAAIAKAEIIRKRYSGRMSSADMNHD